MNDETTGLSPAAQTEHDRRMEECIHSENWNLAYLDLLREWAAREIPDLADVEAKGRGLAEWEKSREDHRIACELKDFAIRERGPDVSAEIGNLPEDADLDQFLKRLMPGKGVDTRRELFRAFLLQEEGNLTVMNTFESLASMESIPAHARYDLGEDFRKWRNSRETQRGRASLKSHNEKKKQSADERRAALAALLPSAPGRPGMERREWRDKAEAAGLVTSGTTFNRDVRMLVAGKAVRKQQDGRFRRKT